MRTNFAGEPAQSTRRFRRIIIHATKYILTDNKSHWYEDEHYYYMKKFKI